MKSIILCVLLTSAMPAPADEKPVPEELLNTNTLYEVVRHLYRWYMDEDDVNNVEGEKEFVFLVRTIEVDLDENDRSQFSEIIIPVPGITVKMKKPDYEIEEHNVIVKGDRFKIVNVARGVSDDVNDVNRVVVDYEEMRSTLFRTRNHAQFPSEEMLTMLRTAVRNKMNQEMDETIDRDYSGEQVIHIAPISPVANELWVFWETGRLLIHFSADIDLVNPAVWDHEELLVNLYDIDEQVVVSLAEVPGSSAYLTRDQVGRALYNCIILGQRHILHPEEMEDL